MTRPPPKPVAPWISLGARPAWDVLHTALAGTAVPCRGEAGAWYSDAPAAQREAAEACARCPLLAECGAYADVAGERFGTWAGRERSRPNSKEAG